MDTDLRFTSHRARATGHGRKTTKNAKDAKKSSITHDQWRRPRFDVVIPAKAESSRNHGERVRNHYRPTAKYAQCAEKQGSATEDTENTEHVKPQMNADER